MTGATFKNLRLSVEVSIAELARELGLTEPTIRYVEQSMKMRPLTVRRYCNALAAVARRRPAERVRERTEAVLAAADLSD